MAHRHTSSTGSATWCLNGDTQVSSRAPLMTSNDRDASIYPDDDSSHLNRHPIHPNHDTKESYRDQQTPTEHYSSDPFATSKLPLYNEAETGQDQRHKRERRRWIWYSLAAVIAALLVLSLGRETSDIPIPAPWRASQQSPAALMPGVRNTFTYSNGTQYKPVPGLKIVGIVFCMLPTRSRQA